MLCIVKSGNRQRARPAVGVDGNLLRRFVNGPNLFPSAFAYGPYLMTGEHGIPQGAIRSETFHTPAVVKHGTTFR